MAVVGRHGLGEEVSVSRSGAPGERRWRSDGRRPAPGTTDGRGVEGGNGGDRAAGVGEDEGGGDHAAGGGDDGARRRGRWHSVGGGDGDGGYIVFACVSECVVRVWCVWCVCAVCCVCVECVQLTSGPMEALP
jgi:hypothetical protein